MDNHEAQNLISNFLKWQQHQQNPTDTSDISSTSAINDLPSVKAEITASSLDDIHVSHVTSMASPTSKVCVVSQTSHHHDSSMNDDEIQDYSLPTQGHKRKLSIHSLPDQTTLSLRTSSGRKRSRIWRTNIVGLALRNTKSVPCKRDIFLLTEKGLGIPKHELPLPGEQIFRKSSIPLDWSEEQFQLYIQSIFPLYENKDFSLFYADKARALIPLERPYLPAILKDTINQGKVFIKPSSDITLPAESIHDELVLYCSPSLGISNEERVDNLSSLEWSSYASIYPSRLNYHMNSDPESVDESDHFDDNSKTPRQIEEDKIDSCQKMLIQHRDMILDTQDNSELSYTYLIIRRKYLWEDAQEYYLSTNFDMKKWVYICFIGEDIFNMDQSQLRQEFFRLLCEQLKSSGLFEGFGNRLLPRHNWPALLRNKYIMAGRMIAHIIFQGNSPPCFLSPVLLQYFSYGIQGIQPSIEDVTSCEIQEILRAIDCVENSKQLQELCNQERVAVLLKEECGFTKSSSSITINDQEEIKMAFLLQHTLFRVKAEADQLAEGMDSLGLIQLCKTYPDYMKQLLCQQPPKKKKLTKLDVESMLSLFDFSFSILDDALRIQEEHVAKNWLDYIVECCGTVDKKLANLKDIVFYVKGMEPFPSDYESKFTVLFSKDKVSPIVKSADSSLILPLYLTKYADFKTVMTRTIQESIRLSKSGNNTVLCS